MYVREDCWPVEERCPGDLMMERVLSNPIYNYQTIKRLAVYFRDVEQAVGGVDFDSEFEQIWQNACRRKKKKKVSSQTSFQKKIHN